MLSDHVRSLLRRIFNDTFTLSTNQQVRLQQIWHRRYSREMAAHLNYFVCLHAPCIKNRTRHMKSLHAKHGLYKNYRIMTATGSARLQRRGSGCKLIILFEMFQTDTWNRETRMHQHKTQYERLMSACCLGTHCVGET